MVTNLPRDIIDTAFADLIEVSASGDKVRIEVNDADGDCTVSLFTYEETRALILALQRHSASLVWVEEA